MTSYRDMHYQAEGLAYVRGMPPDDIPIYLEREKSIKLLKGLSASKGFKYVEEHGVEWLLNAAFRIKSGLIPAISMAGYSPSTDTIIGHYHL